MAVEISDITPKYPGMIPSGAQARDLVSEKFEQTYDFADEAFEDAQSALAALKSLYPLSYTSPDIEYEYIEASLGAEVDAAPEDPDVNIEAPDPPSCGDLEDVTIPYFSAPSDPSDPAAEFIYNEPVYQSELLTALKSALLDYVQNGGTGLDADVEDAIWERAKARKDLLNEKVYDEAENYFAAKGFVLPPGALGGRLTEALQEQVRADAQINYEIMIEQGRLAQTNTHFTITSSIQLEGQEREFFDRIANRAFNKAKVLVDVVINLYNAKMSGFIARVEKYKADASIAKIKGELAIGKNRIIIEEFQAKVAKYDAELRSEIGIAEAIGRIYGYKVAGYEAKSRIAIANLGAQVELFKGRIAQSDNQTRLSLAEAEMVLKAYLAAADMQGKASEGVANVTAQLAASAMSAVNASASLGYSTGYTRGDGIRASTAISESASKTETTLITD